MWFHSLFQTWVVENCCSWLENVSLASFRATGGPEDESVFAASRGFPISHLAPRPTSLSVAMHTRGNEECSTNVASEKDLTVWMSASVCTAPSPQIAITYTERITGDNCVFHWQQNASCPGELLVVVFWCGCVWLLLPEKRDIWDASWQVCWWACKTEVDVTSGEHTDQLIELDSCLQTQYA